MLWFQYYFSSGQLNHMVWVMDGNGVMTIALVIVGGNKGNYRSYSFVLWHRQMNDTLN